MNFNSFLKICGIVFLAGCARSINGAFPKSSSDVDQLSDFPSWIDTIIDNSLPRVAIYQCSHETRNSLQTIDTAFLKEYLMGFEIDFPQNWEFNFDRYSRYYFFDYQKFESWFSFTIMNNTEYGYDNYYTYTFDLKSNKITTVSCIAQRGVDGSAIDEEQLQLSESGRKLTVRSQSYFDDYLFDNDGSTDCYARSFDSIVSNFLFYANKTEFSIDTIFSSVDTLCFE